MKLNKAEKAAAVVALCFVVLLAGYTIGAEKHGGGFTVMPARAEGAAQESVPSAGPQAQGTARPDGLTAENAGLFPLDINTATAEELCELPGIGPTLAERIIACREAAGGFTHIEELMDVSGIGEGIFGKVKDMVIIGGGS